jgi:hypothetical protein
MPSIYAQAMPPAALPGEPAGAVRRSSRCPRSRRGVNVAPVHDEGSPVTVDPVRRAWEAIDFRTPLVVRALADTGLFAALAEGSATTAHLAPACSLHPGSLERALHLLIAADIVRRNGDAWESSDGREVTASTRRCLTRSPGTWSSSSLTELRL